MVYYPCSWKVKILSLLAHILLLTSSSLFTVSANDDLSVLLSFKSSITNDPRKALSSWDVAGNGSSTPEAYYCQWNGVACNNRRHPGRVTAIRLRDSGLTGTISPQLGNLTRLQILDLSNNNLIGKIPSNLGSCTKLLIMNLSMNYLNGFIPDDLGHLSKLNIFNIRHNNITGNIPMSLSNLTRLTDLTMENNNLQGLIPSWFGNLTMLKAIDLAINSFGGHIPGYLGKLTELAILMMQGNRLEGLLPQSIFNISSIEHLDIGMNLLSGSLPLDIGFKLPKLKFLSTFMNHFDGPIPSSLSNSSALEYLIMHENRYHGLIPRDIGVHGNLKLFSVGHNELQATKPTDWDFLTSLTNCSNLGSLNLYENNLVGVMPATFANLSQELVWLRLHRNQISGTIPEGLAVFQKLTEFTLQDNLFTGTLPLDIGRLSNLVSLDLSHNRFEGPIPESLGNITKLSKLSLSNNLLNSIIPTSLHNLTTLVSMDLSYNLLKGQIPQEILSIPSLSIFLNLSNNALSGPIPTQIGNLNSIGTIDLSMNKLTGEIPDAVRSCVQLRFLYFQGNLLQGQIPKGLNTLGVLENLDLSSNNLTGPIPEFLGNIRSLNYLNLSFNNLSGPVPKTGIFRNVMISTLQGNSMLCGGLPLLQLPSCPSIDSHQAVQHRLRILIFCTIGTSIFLFACTITAYCYIKTRGKPYVHTQRHRFLSQNHERISYADLHAATQSFSPANLIGSGSFGNVYIGTLIMDDDLATVAIKVLDLGRQGASRSFFTECDALRRIRHRKLVKVITVCSSLDHNGEEFKALVLEFICNGSLDEWLHPNTMTNSTTTRKLSLMRRLYIAHDVAEALEYLHHHTDPTIVHCDIKPSNILLDDDLIAHVTDFGLAKIMHVEACKKNQAATENSSFAVKGTIGYVPPEYGSGSGVSTNGDVYSYGVLLLEMLTGRRPTDSFIDGETSLINFVKMAYPKNLLEILDVTATYSGNTQDIIDVFIYPMFRLALACCEYSPRQRMKMDNVVEELNAIKKSCSLHISSS